MDPILNRSGFLSLCQELLISTLFLFAAPVQGAVVGPGGYTNSFGTQPVAMDWATSNHAGTQQDSYDMDSDVNGNITVAGVSSQVNMVAADPPSTAQLATWSSTGYYLQTRPTSVRYVALMGKFVNNTGTNATQVRISYLYTLAGSGPAEDTGKGTRVYYSLTGELNSWTNIPALNHIDNSNASLVMTQYLAINWANGGRLYLLWVDDNSPQGGSDAANQIDNFSLQVTSDQPQNFPPTVNLVVPSKSSQIPAGTSITLKAAASDPNNNVIFVEFFDRTNLLGSATTAPYELAWGNPGTGIHVLTARATDGGGLQATSAVVILEVVPANAEVILYPDFTGVSNLWLLGSAGIVTNRLRLTPSLAGRSGGAWAPEKLAVKDGFETAFQFQIHQFGNTGADGFAFVIYNGDSPVIGSSGGAMGYGGIPSSLVVEFDTYWNPEGADLDGNHVGVHTRGTAPNATDESAALARATPLVDLSDGGVHTVYIRYSHGQLKVFLDDLGTPLLQPTLDLGMLLNLQDGSAWLGFTSSTGADFENHDILTWSFRANRPPQIQLYATGTSPLLVPVALVIGAEGSDPDGDRTQVEFFLTNTSMGTVYGAPYVIPWENPQAGTYVWTAISMDEFGARTTAPALQVPVFAVPRISRVASETNGSLAVEFATTFGQTYTIQYSSDLVNWTNAIPSVLGTGGLTLWHDTGPPGTASPPQAQAQRFYRVFVSP